MTDCLGRENTIKSCLRCKNIYKILETQGVETGNFTIKYKKLE